MGDVCDFLRPPWRVAHALQQTSTREVLERLGGDTDGAFAPVRAARAIGPILAFALAGCGVPVDPCRERTSGGDRPATVAELSALRSLHDVVGAPGISLGVQWGGDPLWVGAVGCASLEPLEQLQPESRFLIGSVTKTYAAALVLQLSREGRLGLDDALSAHLPELSGLNGATIRQALNHTSGLFNFNEDPHFRERIANGWSSRELATDALSTEPYFPAGEGFHYSNTNYVLAGMVAERAGGQALSAQLRSRFFQPLGLSSTAYFEGESAGEFVQSYQLNCGFLGCDGHAAYPPEAFTPFPGFAGAIASSARDTLVWARALVDGRVLTAEERAAQRTFVEANGDAAPEVERYGLGWMDYGGGAEGHTGLMPGFHSTLVYREAEDLLVVAFVNESGNGETFIRQVHSTVVQALLKERMQ